MPLLMKLGGELKKWVTGEHETSLAVCFSLEALRIKNEYIN